MVPIQLLLRRVSGCYITCCRTKHLFPRNFIHTSFVCCDSKPKKYTGSGKTGKGLDADTDLKKAVKNVADSLPGDADKTASELLSRLRLHAASSTTSDPENSTSKPIPTLGDLFSGMKIEAKDKSDSPRSTSLKSRHRGHRSDLGGYDKRSQSRRGLFDGPRLNIFEQKADKKDVGLQVTEETLWDVVEREELEELTNTPASNAFEEMIQLTEQGKLWQFPINNEQGMDEEAKYEFHDHIFFDDLLEDFPKKGPVRHFMELVTIGLSKNPFMTVPQKREHIEWFREYFKDKQHILEEVTDSANVQ